VSFLDFWYGCHGHNSLLPGSLPRKCLIKNKEAHVTSGSGTWASELFD
jgi:hypothetical protein